MRRFGRLVGERWLRAYTKAVWTNGFEEVAGLECVRASSHEMEIKFRGNHLDTKCCKHKSQEVRKTFSEKNHYIELSDQRYIS